MTAVAHPTPLPTTARRAALVLPVACGATFLAFLDSTIANLAIPDLDNTFHGAGVTNLSWVITLYVITFAALLSPAGRLADLLGRRRVFTAGVALFTLCSVLAAAAPTFGVLLVARAAQGVGAAAMIPASLGLILTSVAPERRSAAIGLWSASAAAAAAFGPPIGGLVVDQFGWRALFALNLPVGLAMLAGARSIPETERAEGRLPDVIGTVLLGTGIGLLVLGVTQGATWGWDNGRTLAALTVGAVMLGASLLRSRSHPAPALEIGLWRIRTFATANAVSFGFGVFLYAWMLNGVLFLVHVWGYSELRAGLAITPGAIAAAAVGIGIGRVANRVTPRALVAGGALLMLAAGLLAGLALPAEPDFVGFWLPLGTIVGFGFGAVSVGVSSAGALSVPPMRFAGATGLNLTGRQLGGAFGVAALATILRGDPGLHGAETANLMCAVAAAVLLVLSPGLSLSPAPAPETATAEATA